VTKEGRRLRQTVKRKNLKKKQAKTVPSLINKAAKKQRRGGEKKRNLPRVRGGPLE